MRRIAAAGDDNKMLDMVADALFAKACEGDVSGIKELADRIDGKVPQGIENGDDGAFHVLQTVERVVVRADPDR